MTSSTSQEIRNCNFNVQGSYTNTVTNTSNLSIIQVTHSYFQRGLKVSSASGTCSQPERISDMLLRAEGLQRSAKMLSEELRLTTRSPVEYRDLIEVLDKVSGETIPNIFRFCINRPQLGKQHEQRILVEIVYIQGILGDFAKKRARDRDLKLEATTEEQNSRRQWRLTLKAFMELLWCSFWWLFYAKYIVTIIRKALLDSQVRINVALFERLACSVDSGVPSHHIQIDDFFGAEWFLPQDLCLNRQAFFSVLRFKYQGGPAESVITSQQFGVFRQAGLQAVQGPDWEKVIEEGEGLRLSVLITQSSNKPADDPKALHCPQCKLNDRTVAGEMSVGWVTCLRCNNNWNMTSVDLSNDNWSGTLEQNSPDTEAFPQEGVDQIDHGSNFRYFSITIVMQHSYEETSSRFTEYEGDDQDSMTNVSTTATMGSSTTTESVSSSSWSTNLNRKSPFASYDPLNPGGLSIESSSGNSSSSDLFSRVFAPSPAERERALNGSTYTSRDHLLSLREVGSRPRRPTPGHARRDMAKVPPSWSQFPPMMRKPATTFNPWGDEYEADKDEHREKSKKGLNPDAKVFSLHRKSPSGSYDALNPNGLSTHSIPSSNSLFSRVFAPSPEEREALQRALGGSTNPSLERLPSLSEVGSMPPSPTFGHAGPALPHVPQHAGRNMTKVLPSWLQSLPMMRKSATTFSPWDDEDEASKGVVYR